MTPARDPGRPDVQTVVGAGGAKAQVPVRALLLSVASLTIPLVATTLTPDFLDEQYALLIWLPALLPAFLLTYYRGWGGASAALVHRTPIGATFAIGTASWRIWFSSFERSRSMARMRVSSCSR